MILNNTGDENTGFVITRNTPKHRKVDLRWHSQKQFEYALAFTLGFFMMAAILFPVFEKEEYAPEVTPNMIFDASTVPVTRQTGNQNPPPPNIPAVPIEAEVENIAEDITIASSDFTSTGFSSIPGPPGPPGPGEGSSGVSVGPRLIKEVFPMVSDRLKGKGIRGEVELRVKIDEYGKVIDVEIVKNTTNSAEIAQAAVEAAFKCVYIPAMSGKKPITVWTIRKLRIDYTE